MQNSAAVDVAAGAPRVLIAIVSMDGVEYLTGCLRALAASTYLNFTVVVCENGGHDAFQRAGRALAGFHFMRPACDKGAPQDRLELVLAATGQRVTILAAPCNLGYAGGVNACIAGDEAWEALWILNPDTFPEPGALAALVQRQKEAGYGIVGSRLIFAGSGLVQTWGGLEWRSWLGRARLIGLNRPAETIPDAAEVERRIAFISGASMYVTRAYVEAVGPMDDAFFMYHEDVDWCLRRGSFALGYAHDSVVRHIHDAAAGNSPRHRQRAALAIYLSERNRVLLARKRYRASWRIRAAIALAETLEHLLHARSARHFGTALAGWRAGIRGETGMPRFMHSGE